MGEEGVGKHHEVYGILLKSWPYLVLSVPVLIFIMVPLVISGGTLGTDFPFLSNVVHPSRVLFTWMDFGSRSNFEYIARLPEIGIGLSLQSLDINPDLVAQLMIISGFIIASFSFYFCLIKLLNEKVRDKGKLQIAAVIGSFFFAYNIWSFDRIVHYYLWLGYAILPLFFISLVLIFRNPKQIKYILVAILSWTLAASTPHMVIFFGIIFLGVTIFFIVKKIRSRHDLFQSGLAAISILSIFILLNSFWIYPFVHSILTGNLDLGNRLLRFVVTKESIELLSRDSSFLSVLRLVNNWSEESIKEPTDNSDMLAPWLFASYFLPALAFVALFSRAFFRYSLVFSLLTIAGILLVMGSNSPLDLYSRLLFDVPIISEFNELFRDPDKWAFLIGFGYSILLSICSYIILEFVSRHRLRELMTTSFLVLVLGSIMVYSYPKYSQFLDSLTPSSEDLEISKSVQDYIATIDTDKILNLPYLTNNEGLDVVWDGRYMSELSAVKPNMGPSSLPSKNYVDYLTRKIVENSTSDINDMVAPLGTSYVVYRDNEFYDDLYDRLQSLKNVNTIKDIQQYTVFRSGNSSISPINIFDLDLAVMGGLDQLTSLNSIEYFDSNDTSIFFMEQNAGNKGNIVDTYVDDIVLRRNAKNLYLSSIDEKYIVAPYDVAVNYDPSTVWSKANAMDATHGEFHKYLDALGIENWDFDYGKGIVMTDAIAARIHVPLDINASGNYDFFVRLLKNEKGGKINLFLDNKPIGSINTLDEKSNIFDWERVASLTSLEQGRHTLTLENAFGFNAINIFAALPVQETARLTENADAIVNKTRNLFLLEAESDFNVVESRNDSLTYHLINWDDSDINSGNEVFHGTQNGTLLIPEGMNQMSLDIFAGPNPKSSSSYKLKNLEISPLHSENEVFKYDFETAPLVPSLGKEKDAYKSYQLETIDIANKDWLNKDDPDWLSTLLAPNGSTLQVDIKQGNKTDWSFLSTDFIPINGNENYTYALDISAKDVNQLHSKVYYYDSNKTEIRWDIISDGKDGTFTDSITHTRDTPSDAAYVKLQIWVHPNPMNASSYTLYDAKIHPYAIGGVWINQDWDTQSVSVQNSSALAAASKATDNKYSKNDGLRVDIEQGNKTDWSILSTDFIPVEDAAYYTYSLEMSGQDVNQLQSKSAFYDLDRNEIMEKFHVQQYGTFKKDYSDQIYPPLGTSYIRFMFLAMSNPDRNSNYLLDNVKLDEYFPTSAFENDFDKFENRNPSSQRMSVTQDSLEVELKNGDPEKLNSIQTNPFPVEEGSRYKYSIAIDIENLTSLNAYASPTSSSGRIEDSNKYGGVASGGKILVLPPKSETYANLDILKTANYTLAIHAKPLNESSSSMRISVEDGKGNTVINNNTVSLANETNGSNLNWFYLNGIPLKSGEKYKITLYTDFGTDFDSAILYSSGSNLSSTLEDVFNQPAIKSAHISSYTKIDPTKYIVNISNATRPYILSLSESYDPLWKASVIQNDGSNDVNNPGLSSTIPLFSIINGFLIDSTGENYSVILEYRPQQWFLQGAIISILTLIILIIVFFFIKKSKLNSLYTKLRSAIK